MADFQMKISKQDFALGKSKIFSPFFHETALIVRARSCHKSRYAVMKVGKRGIPIGQIPLQLTMRAF